MESSYSDPAEFTGHHHGSAQQGGTMFPNGPTSPVGEPTYGKTAQKPIVGFLYSISKSGVGEFWPLHIGANTIGRSPSCDVCLSEGTVSEKHATLVVRVMKNPEKVIASVCDSSSTIGTMVNGESLGFDQRECFNGDIITIGAHYDLYFILIDAKQIGLKVCDEFIPVQSSASQFGGGNVPFGTNPTVDIPSPNPYAPPVGGSTKRTRDFEDVDSAQSGGTRGLPTDVTNPSSEESSPTSGGRTIFM